ncbi:MAG TPA: RidA family protein [Sediminibacterium sp.]
MHVNTKKWLVSVCLFISFQSFSQTNTPIVSFRNPKTVSTPTGYSHVAEIDLGNCTMLLISGQVAIDSSGSLIGRNDLAKQTEQVFTNIKNLLAASGGTMDHLVKTGIFMRDVSQIQLFREIRNKFINSRNPPTSTLVEVSRLFRDEILIEIEATAIIPKK